MPLSSRFSTGLPSLSARIFTPQVYPKKTTSFSPGKQLCQYGKLKVLLKRADIDKFLESKRVGSDLDQMVDEVMADLRGGK